MFSSPKMIHGGPPWPALFSLFLVTLAKAYQYAQSFLEIVMYDPNQALATLFSPLAAREHSLTLTHRFKRIHGWHPEKSTVPLSCMHEECFEWSLHRIRSISEDQIVSVCNRGHKNIYTIPATSDEIRGSYTRGMTLGGKSVTLFQANKFLKLRHSEMWKRIQQFQYSQVPQNFTKPDVLHAAVLPGLELWDKRNQKLQPCYTGERRTALIFDRLYPKPMFKWVRPDFFNALQMSDPPSADLSELNFAWEQGVFFFQENSLRFPSGNPCSFIAFSRIDEGYTAIFDNRQANYAPCPKLLVWAFSDQLETFTGELTLSGVLANAVFHQKQNPGSEENQEFLRRIFNLVIMLNYNAALNPVIVEDSRLLRKVRKHGKKNKNLPPSLVYSASMLGMPRENPKFAKMIKAENGSSPCSHWRKAHPHKFYRGPLNGKREAFYLYMPLQWIKGRNEQVTQ